MSDTPKTDSAEWQITRRFTNEEVMVVTVDFARQLERELAAVTRERDEFQRMAGANGLAGLEVGRENDALRAEVERLRAAIKGQASLLPPLPTAPPGSYARGYDSGMRDTITAISAALQEPTP